MQALRDGIDHFDFRPHYIDFGHMSPYADAAAFYCPAPRAPGDSRLFVSELFDSGRVTEDGSSAGGTFVYNSPYGKARDKARRRSKWVQRDEVDELTLLEAIQSRSISPTFDDAKYYLNHHVSHLSIYISATHHVKQSMPHGLPSTSAGMSECLNKMEQGPAEARWGNTSWRSKSRALSGASG